MTSSRDSLWTIIAGPTVWAVYFLLCYVPAAVYCAKADSTGAGLGTVRVAIAAFTVIALALIVHAGVLAYRHWGFGTDDPPHDDDTLQDRRRFLGYATLLLCGLSFVATIYVALPALMIPTCR
jgi:hypothetical protein